MEDGRGNHYWYDAEEQLTDAYYGAIDPVTNPHSFVREDHFIYDALGNRQSWNWLANRGSIGFGRRDNGLNQYSYWSPVSNLTYDDTYYGSAGNGVLMQDGTITASYNALNQPTKISVPGYGSDFLWFGYDPLGRCVKRWMGPANASAVSAPTYFVYDGWNRVEEGTSPWSPSRVYFHGARTDEVAASYDTASGVLGYHYYDANGNCTMVSNFLGDILEQYDYDAFGLPHYYSASGSDIGSSTFGNRFLFTGREWLSDLKLYDYRNRMYQPELGRFMQPDPKQFGAGDYNLYRYCHNDPINRNDPFGLFESPGWMQATIPGQVEWDAAVTNFQAGNYGWAAAYSCAMIGQQVVAIVTLGASQRVTAPLQAARTVLVSNEAAALAKSPVMQKVEKQLAEHGEKSLQKSLSSFEQRIAEHAEKIKEATSAGGNTSSMQREMRAFEKERDAIKQLLEKKEK
jgi:RHS repeat-associated protein